MYNFADWKLRSQNGSTVQNMLQKNLGLLIETQKKHHKPFGAIVTSPSEVEIASQYTKFLYLPGEICRQSDILEACSKTNLPIFVEKGVF